MAWCAGLLGGIIMKKKIFMSLVRVKEDSATVRINGQEYYEIYDEMLPRSKAVNEARKALWKRYKTGKMKFQNQGTSYASVSSV
jgi:hypothetical protein